MSMMGATPDVERDILQRRDDPVLFDGEFLANVANGEIGGHVRIARRQFIGRPLEPQRPGVPRPRDRDR
jgi:hypothetical protein